MCRWENIWGICVFLTQRKKHCMPKRYNLKSAYNSNHSKINPIKCPKCKSDNITIRSRRNYLVKSIVCLVIIGFCCVVFSSLRNEEVDRVVIIGVFGCLICSSLSLILGLNYLIRGLLIKETNFTCEYCKNKFRPAPTMPA